ncbi:helix-turn-helix domain-containing protein [Leptospira langatensis]|uniref:helix-turn-helix domain-containing protein n=1 Tax=Leptospira langatensis TaxID=2484983 RepID=UPI0014383C85|nr:helix-turn-helix domain-containing protein [Leptospira langatensis]
MNSKLKSSYPERLCIERRGAAYYGFLPDFPECQAETSDSEIEVIDALKHWLAQTKGAKSPAAISFIVITPQVSKIIGDAAHNHGLSIIDLLKKGRYPEVVVARREAFLALLEIKLSKSQIGRIFNMEHTSVLYSIRRSKEELIR